MTISTYNPRVLIPHADLVNPIEIGVQVLVNSHVKVYADNTLLNIGTHYTLSGIGNPDGFSVHIVDPQQLAPSKWVVLIDPPIDQGSDLSVGGLFGTAYENGLDELTRRMLAMDDRIRRSYAVSVSADYPAPGAPLGGFGMTASTYDPTNKAADAFDSANHAYADTITSLGTSTTQTAIDKMTVRGAGFPTVAALLADTTLDYSAGAGKIAHITGEIVSAGGFRYQVAASGASDHHVTTAGGAKLYVLPDATGVNLLAFGASTAAASNDAYLTAAVAATNGPIHVPYAAGTYAFTALSAAVRKRLFGFGKITVAGVATPISTSPWINNASANQSVYNEDWQPSQWSTTGGSLWNGSNAARLVRTGGYPSYGADLVDVAVDAQITGPNFDIARTQWISAKNMANGIVFAGWSGANGPRRGAAGHAMTGGSIVSHVFNTGNIWGYVPLRETLLNTVPFYAGWKAGADPVPSRYGSDAEWTVAVITIAAPGVVTVTGHDFVENLAMEFFPGTGTLPGGITAGSVYYAKNISGDTFQLSSVRGGAAITTTGTFSAGVVVHPSYPGHFGGIITQTVHGHQWHIGLGNMPDSIVHGGRVLNLRGGSSATDRPDFGIRFSDHLGQGINLANATISGNAVTLGDGQKIGWATGAIINSPSGGDVSITSAAGSTSRVRIYGNNSSAALFVGGWNGTATIMGFHGASPIAKPSLPVAATDPATTQALVNSIRAALINYGLTA